MKKGFTLVELVMVIVVLGIVALIAVPTVNSIITDSREKTYKNQIKTIENTAHTYTTKYQTELPSQTDGSSNCITVEELKKAGLLPNEKIINPNYKTGGSDPEELDGAVKVSWKKNKYIYEYKHSKTC